MTPKWEYSEPSPDGTHHVDRNGLSLYSARFRQVLPFHDPGLAPVADETGAYHIRGDGHPAYRESHSRTFGFYQRIAAVTDANSWFHITEDGARLYDKDWVWCGNFQNDRCTVRDENGDYYHIRKDGAVVPNGPWVYAGDFREGAAVVRGEDGLCRHVDSEGNLIHDKEFFDLDVYHKGFARARDGDGWFHIDRKGEDVSFRRYEYLEPFYNGQALAQLNNGQRVVIDEGGKIIRILPISEMEVKSRLHQIAVSCWVPFAIKLGIENGLADGEINSKLSTTAKKVLKEAWMEIGLLEEDGISHTVLGKRLKSGSVERDRLEFWLGPELDPWLSENLYLKSVKNQGRFDEISSNSELVALTQRVLNSYAMEDWNGIGNVIPVDKAKVIVDIGGGMGALLRDVRRKYPTKKYILFERPDVAEIISPTEDFEVIPGNFFEDPLPTGDLFILSRVLHDWPDIKVLKILERLTEQISKHTRICVIERIKEEPKQHGLLSLHMYLGHGSYERNHEDWKSLFEQCGWRIDTLDKHRGHWVMTLKQDISDRKKRGGVL